MHVQFEPPGEPGLMDGMAGSVTSAGIHIESFDEEVRQRVAPGKCARSLEAYVRTWNRAVELLGAGRVSSFIIAGLGENDHSILEGTASSFPGGLSLRPAPAPHTGDAIGRKQSLPRPTACSGYTRAAAKIIDASGLRAAEAGAGCVRCGSCSAITHYTG